MHANGGCPFATDPALTALEASVYWTPAADPGTILISAAPTATADHALASPLPGRDRRRDGGDTYERIEVADATFPAIVQAELRSGTLLAAIILLDDDAVDRMDALTRFLFALQRRRVPPDSRLTPQRRIRLRQMLRTVDGRREGATYRAIAEALFPDHQIETSSFAGNALRETTIRLARDGMKLVGGGYRALLRKPRRPQ